MILAAVGGIHGHLPALQAALAAIDEAGIHTILNTGDSVVGYAWPNEVVDLLRDRSIPSAQGELDRLAVVYLRKEASLRAKGVAVDLLDRIRQTNDDLRSDNVEFLRSLPRCRSLTVDGISIALCHGTLTSQSDSLRADGSDNKFRRQREIFPARIIVCGRTPDPFSRLVDDTLFVNPGCVGGPSGKKPRARYAIINAESEPWSAEMLSVSY